MNLRQIAEADLAVTLEDATNGFGWSVKLYDPSGNYVSLTGQSSDISQMIDPDTGQMVSGRMATVTLRLSTLRAKGVEAPRGISESNSRPWVVEFDDILGQSWKFKVLRTSPDRTLGTVTCYLEAYQC